VRSNCFKPFEEIQIFFKNSDIFLKSCLFSSNLQFHQPKHLTNQELFFNEKFADQEVNTATNTIFKKPTKKIQKIAKSTPKNPQYC
jgi:hypothetical protein